jgi:hypothetical protein
VWDLEAEIMSTLWILSINKFKNLSGSGDAPVVPALGRRMV